MKTLRQILFERHRPAESKLDVIRRNALAELAAAGTAESVARAGHRETRAEPPAFRGWRGLLFSLRWHLAGMSAIWFVVVLLNLERSPAPTVALAGQREPSPGRIVASIQANRRQLREMIEPPAVEPSATPRRRSELQPRMGVV